MACQMPLKDPSAGAIHYENINHWIKIFFKLYTSQAEMHFHIILLGFI